MTNNDTPPDSTVLDVKPDETKALEVKQPEQQKDRSFNPIATANVLARQTDEEIQATIDALARKRPDFFKAPDDAPPPPVEKEKGKEPAPANDVSAQIAELKKENWVNAALLEYGLKPEHKQFITGNSENAVKTSAYKLRKMLDDAAPTTAVNAEPDPAPPPPPGGNQEKQPEKKDDQIPVYTGYSEKPSVEECKKAIAEGIHDMPWAKH